MSQLIILIEIHSFYFYDLKSSIDSSDSTNIVCVKNWKFDNCEKCEELIYFLILIMVVIWKTFHVNSIVIFELWDML